MVNAGSAHHLIWEITHRNREADRDWLFNIPPDLSSLSILSAGPIFALSPKNWDIITTDYPTGLVVGDIRKFRLQTNALKSITGHNRKFDLVEYYDRRGIQKSHDEMIKEWLTDRQSKFGFSLNSIENTTFSRTIFWHDADQRINAGVFSIQGTLMITNTEDLSKAICTGIGSKRSFGFGLLLLEEK